MFSRFIGWARRLLGGKASRPEAPKVPAIAMHFVPFGSQRAVCGASVVRRWTVEHQFATCPECREIGAGGAFRRFLSVR